MCCAWGTLAGCCPRTDESSVEVCDFCLTEGNYEYAVESLPWRGGSLGLCEKHCFQCPWEGCGKWPKNKRALQSHISRHKRMEREAAGKTTALSEAQ